MKKYKKINSQLQHKIIAMVRIDQNMRKSGRWNPVIDKKNTRRIKSIINKYGWPGKSLVGEKGADGAWLLVQHADHDLKFQKKCLQLLKDAVSKNEAKKSHLAYLTDRILMYEGKRQLYGTQFRLENKTNSLRLYPVYDKKNLDKRRAEMGLEPFHRYEKAAKKSFERLIRNST